MPDALTSARASSWRLMPKATLKPKKLARLQAQLMAAQGKNLLDQSGLDLSGYALLAHTHPIAGITGLVAALAAKADALLNVTTLTASATLGATERIVLVDATAGAVTITLPALATGRIITVKKIDASANAVTLDGAGADTLDGTATRTIASQYGRFTAVSGAPGTQWWLV